MADQQSIAKRAHELYLQRGSEPGHELEDWLQAESELADAESPATDETSERPAVAGGTRRNRREQPQPNNRRSLRP